ncbi:hypothetical protein [Roseomonas sp. 18066]|uniref:hypothetical protein n=1 Tax=Roseomonas sp. 18066 TaxID=2681412 RepID=UPI00135C3C20|nr:hypothetical protein [Roseomonas sp. 18066]
MTDLPDRFFLSGDPAVALSRLSGAGRVMAVLSGPGVLLERIGTLEAVVEVDGWLEFRGPSHTARLRRDALAAVVFDRTPRMRDKPLPRVELQGADGVSLMTLHGLDGGEGFDAALGPVAGEVAPPRVLADVVEEGAASPEPARMLAALRALDVPLRVTLRTATVVQHYEGLLPESREMGGHQNLIQADFHLHLADSAVARWRQEGRRLLAEGASGAPLGLEFLLPEGVVLA